jgi:hypothetical protein
MPKDIEKTEIKNESTGSVDTLNEQLKMLVEMNKNLVQTVNALLKTQIEAKEGVKHQCLDAGLCEQIGENAKQSLKAKIYTLRAEKTFTGHKYYPVTENGEKANFVIVTIEKPKSLTVQCETVGQINLQDIKNNAETFHEGKNEIGTVNLLGTYPLQRMDDGRVFLNAAISKLNSTMGRRCGFFVKM